MTISELIWKKPSFGFKIALSETKETKSMNTFVLFQRKQRQQNK